MERVRQIPDGNELTSSSSKTSQGVMSPMQSCTRRRSPSEMVCMCQSRSTSKISSSLSLRSLCLYPPTESRKWDTRISLRTTGFIALSAGGGGVSTWTGAGRRPTNHSVPRNATPGGESLNTSLSLIRTSALLTRRFPARICNKVDFPAG